MMSSIECDRLPTADVTSCSNFLDMDVDITLKNQVQPEKVPKSRTLMERGSEETGKSGKSGSKIIMKSSSSEEGL